MPALNLHFCILHGATAPSWTEPPLYRGFTITFRYITFVRTPLNEWSTRRKDLYLTTQNTHNRLSCSRTGFEPAIAACKRPHSPALDSAATGLADLKLIPLFSTWCRKLIRGSLNLFPLFSWINPLQTKLRLLYLKTQSVPRCKHFSSRL
jgi:hypothetical protein